MFTKALQRDWLPRLLTAPCIPTLWNGLIRSEVSDTFKHIQCHAHAQWVCVLISSMSPYHCKSTYYLYVCTLSSHFGLCEVSLTVPQVPYLCHNSHTYTSYCSCVRSSHTALTVSQETMCNRSFLQCVCSIEFAQICTWRHLYNYIVPFYRGRVRMNIMSPVAMKWKGFGFESNTTTVILDFFLGLLSEKGDHHSLCSQRHSDMTGLGHHISWQ